MFDRAVHERWHRVVDSFRQSGIRVVARRPVVYLWKTRRWGPPGKCVDVSEGEQDGMAMIEAVIDAGISLMKRPEPMGDKPATVVPLHDDMAAKRWPLLWEHLSCTRYEDGSAREPSSLLIFLQEGALKGMLRDKDGQRCLWTAARGLLPLLEAIEGHLDDPQPDWRPDRSQKGQPAPRGRKAG